jgi:hypothetical protein
VTNWPGPDEEDFDDSTLIETLLPVRALPPGPREGPWLRVVLGVAAAVVFVTRATMPFVLLLADKVTFEEAADLMQRPPDVVDLVFVAVLAFYFGRNSTWRRLTSS